VGRNFIPPRRSNHPMDTTPPTPLLDRSIFLDKMGRLRTQSLFREFEISGYPALFTLSPEGDYTDPDTGRYYVSLRRLFVESLDPTEYTFAQRAFGSWHHWDRIRNLLWFEPYVSEWRKELDARLSSIGSRAIIESVEGTRPDLSIPSAKFLANKEWRSGGTKAPKRGRPTREEIEGERKRAASERRDLEEDAERIGLNS